MKSRTKKTLIIVIGVVVIGGGAAFSLIGDNSNATTVQVDLAKIRDISEQVSASGRIQPQTKVEITSQVSGEIVALYISEGEIVSKGDLLIQIDRVQLGSDREQRSIRWTKSRPEPTAPECSETGIKKNSSARLNCASAN